MSVVATCPECERQVTIPDGVDSAVPVRCPLCSAEYPLSEALATVPPELVPLAMIGDGMPSAPVAETLAPGPDEVEQPAENGFPLDAQEEVDQVPLIDIREGPLEEEVVDVGAISFAPDEPLGSAQPTAAGRGRRTAQTGAFRQLAGTIVGGFLGLAIGYYLLNCFFGQRFDFLEIPLPGISHTYRHLPDWADPQADPADPEAPPTQPAAESTNSQPAGGQQAAGQDWPSSLDQPRSLPLDGSAEKLFEQPAETPVQPAIQPPVQPRGL